MYKLLVYPLGWVAVSAIGFWFMKTVFGTADYIEVIGGAVVIVLSFLGANCLEALLPPRDVKREGN